MDMKLKERIVEAMNRFKEEKCAQEAILENYCSESYNNLVAKISIDGENYAVKSYQLPHVKDRRDRYKAEVNYINYCKNFTEANNLPDLEAQYEDINCTILSWVEGVKIKKFDFSDIVQIAEFIEKTNSYSAHNKREHLGYASEYCKTSNTISKNTLNEINRLKNSTSDSKMIDLIESLQNKAQIEYNKLSNLTLKSWWQEKEFIASPSDIGIQNCLRSKNNLFFIDFEYAGLDDLAKLINDLVHQPNYQFNQAEEYAIINEIEKRHICSNAWRQRYEDLKESIKIRWATIKLKKALKTSSGPHALLTN